MLNRLRHPYALLALAAAAILLLTVAVEAHRSGIQAEIVRSDPEAIMRDPRLKAFALDRGAAVYRANCASCHGPDGKPDQSLGVPDLTDDDFLYGSGKVAEIEDIARFGIRSSNRRGRNLASMPAYASAHPYKLEPLPPQSPRQIEDLTQRLLSFTGRQTDQAAADRGDKLFRSTAGCWDCHQFDASGDSSTGSPTLSDSTWLYGGSHDDIYRSISRGRAGISPAFERKLSPAELRDVAVYVADLARRSPSVQ
ncbi:c-type cytochrome [Sphingomonas sp. CL5.1]|uniref:c-type cytochrome n=1 Tax=Sphingomonas sp. CL5.1 TaxID=2653203 RepID=UPI001583D95D|nr:c-type cytochrome [Sphingomonas sp. CL5.1]QKS01186.1 c-type cytochrome [Sphingomonas sp. CL5.1]